MELMNIFNKRKYRELYDLGISEELINGLLANTQFKNGYEGFKSSGTFKLLLEQNIDKVQIQTAFQALLTVLNNKDLRSFIDSLNNKDYSTISNEETASWFRETDFFNTFLYPRNWEDYGNIFKLINDGYGEQLVEFFKMYPNIHLNSVNLGSSEVPIKAHIKDGGLVYTGLRPEFFSDESWKLIRKLKENSTDIDKNLYYYLTDKEGFLRMDLLAKIVNNGLIEGMNRFCQRDKQRTDPNQEVEPDYILDFLSEIKNNKEPILEQFSISFIEGVGEDVLKRLYAQHWFDIKNEYKAKTILGIAKEGNYQLIKDIVAYNDHCFNNGNWEFNNFNKHEDIFGKIGTGDYKKNIFEIGGNAHSAEIFFAVYLGLNKYEVPAMKLFINSFDRIGHDANMESELQAFEQEHGEFYNFIKIVLTISSTPNGFSKMEEIGTQITQSKSWYKQKVRAMQKAGNDLLRKNFVDDMKKRSERRMAQCAKEEIKYGDDTIPVYTLEGQPFSMLIHAVRDLSGNRQFIHNDIAKKILEDPRVFMAPEVTGGNFLSTSLISDKFMVSYDFGSKDSLIFGFDNISPQTVLVTAPTDTGSKRDSSKDDLSLFDNTSAFYVQYSNVLANIRTDYLPPTNVVTTVDNLMQKTLERFYKYRHFWNEIVLQRSSNGIPVKPSYIVCYDEINEVSKKAAMQYGIPIYVIKRDMYKEAIKVEDVFAQKIKHENEITHGPTI